MNYVCSTSVDLLADSDKFPEDWLFKHRWNKSKKNQTSVLPNGNKIVFLTVGGRTSAVVPAVQKKTGPVAKEIDDEDAPGENVKNETGGKRKRSAVKEEDDEEKENTVTPKRTASKRGRPANTKASTSSKKKTDSKASVKKDSASLPNPAPGRRRSTRKTK
jgi:formamidopyrimidine-DNA glycosylase